MTTMTRTMWPGYGRGWVYALLTLTACGPREAEWVAPTPAAEPVGPQIHITGVVRHMELEGGFFAIRGDDSVTYNPTNLPAEFQKDGLAVEADARHRNDMAGIHQVGPLVQLERIRLR
jgi:hypothetical protein